MASLRRGVLDAHAGEEERRADEERTVRSVVVAEMHRCDRRAVRFPTELLTHEEVARKVEPELGRDPRQ